MQYSYWVLRDKLQNRDSDISVVLFPESLGISRKELHYVLEISIALESFVIIFEIISWLPITLTDFQSVGAHDLRIRILENSDYF